MRKAFVILLLSIAVTSLGLANIDSFAQDKSDMPAVIKGNNEFAFDLYAKLSKEDGNLFFSPASISTALAMTYVGARGNTASQMANALHFILNSERLHPAFSEIMKELEADPKNSGYQLSIANALWGQAGYRFYDEFINVTKNYYDTGFKEVDFKNPENREKTRQAINAWIESKTNDKIKDLIKPDSFDKLTRLVLTNVIYFKGKWQFQFDKEKTLDDQFTLLSGEKIKVPMMNQKKELDYAENDVLQIIEIPYVGYKLSMIILLPKKIDGLKEMESLLTQENISKWLSKLHNEGVIVSLPKFKMTHKFVLNEPLKSLGMIDAFNIQTADFSGMAPDPVGLYISEAIHKAFVDVNEEGTEAAAATATVIRAQCVMPPAFVFKADRPFVFLIKDTKSGSILFMGRIEDPRS